MTKPIDLRAAIRARLAETGMSQTELGKAIGRTQPNVSAYLAGRLDWGGETVGAALAAVGLRVTASKTP